MLKIQSLERGFFVKKILHNKMNLLLAFTVAIMCLGVFTPKSHAAMTTYSNSGPITGGTFKGETVSYQVTLTGETIVEMYMDKKTAIQYANKVTQSISQQIAWFGTALALGKKAPQTSTYVSFMGLMNSIQTGIIQSKVRALTDKNKKVKVSCYITSASGKAVANYTVKAWDGKIVNMKGVKGIRNLKITYY
ncbi:hypothetical protein J6TS2_33850 [Heyndrickxia sporothermodurans]|nr:hypothetical protein J6TS2_33850 [Heyndrickxia sporothermodurans]